MDLPALIEEVASAIAIVRGAIIPAYRWVARRFQDANPEVKERIVKNARDFGERLNRVGKEVAAESRENERAMESAGTEVSVTAMVQDAVEIAVETDDPEKHEYLARMVVMRMLTENESNLAISIRLACEATRNLTRKHLHTLGLLVLFGSFPGEEELTLEAYSEWLEKCFHPFEDMITLPPPDNTYSGITYTSMLQLEGLSLVKIAPRITVGGSWGDTGPPHVISEAVRRFGQDKVFAIPLVRKLNVMWAGEHRTDYRLADVRLTLVGEVLGDHVLAALAGITYDWSHWPRD